jgi:hypothetical protein
VITWTGHISRAEFDSALRERANLALDEMLLEVPLPCQHSPRRHGRLI